LSITYKYYSHKRSCYFIYDSTEEKVLLSGDIGGYGRLIEDTALDNNIETGTIVTVLKISEYHMTNYFLELFLFIS